MADKSLNVLSASESAVALLPEAERKEAERVAAEVAAKIANNPALDFIRTLANRNHMEYYSDEDETPPPSPKKNIATKGKGQVKQQEQTPQPPLTPSTTGGRSSFGQVPHIPAPVPWIDQESPIKLFYADNEKKEMPPIVANRPRMSSSPASAGFPALQSSPISSPPNSLGRRGTGIGPKDSYPFGMAMIENLNLGPDYGPLQRPSLRPTFTTPALEMPEPRRRRPTLVQAVSSAFSPTSINEPVRLGPAPKTRGDIPRRPSAPPTLTPPVVSTSQGNAKFEPRRPHDNTSLFYVSSSRQDLAHIPHIRPGPRPSLATMFSTPEVANGDPANVPFTRRRPSLADMMAGRPMEEVPPIPPIPPRLSQEASFGTVKSNRSSEDNGKPPKYQFHRRGRSGPAVYNPDANSLVTPTHGNAFSPDFWAAMGLRRPTGNKPPFPDLNTTSHPEGIKAYNFVCETIAHFWNRDDIVPLAPIVDSPSEHRSSSFKRQLFKAKFKLSGDKDTFTKIEDFDDIEMAGKLSALPKPMAERMETISKPVLDPIWGRAKLICEGVLNAARERINEPAKGYDNLDQYIQYKPAHYASRLEALEVQDARDVEQYASRLDFEGLLNARAMLERRKGDEEYKVPDEGWQLVWATKFYEWALEKEETERRTYTEKLEQYKAMKDLSKAIPPPEETESEDEEEIEWKEWLAESRKLLKYEPKKSAAEAEENPRSTLKLPSPTPHGWKEMRRERRRARLTDKDVEDWDVQMSKAMMKEKERQKEEAAEKHVRKVSRHSA
ncbi:hypothetical protein P154DRAFT_610460 [Amniculicola lignicola CBS 123094]|uniref:Uncharacterized protein n=1 Tax=Amniculicola lignicola CBS 123094 TaxID=1392246 RepID=A0A6A5WUV3_9PLEO|nr:hypothetical protein P154DRAFT_610460 [Amniculicola lignicola CBS 123094]